ncbi:hypothetical protein RCH20_000668 [Psychrobacter sp. PL15]|nr:hypothetical protein [Psychrobacter sp. PL15]
MIESFIIKILSPLISKTALSASLVVVLLGTAVGCTTVTPNDNNNKYRHK